MVEIQKTPFVRDLASSGKKTTSNQARNPEKKRPKLIISTDKKVRDKAVESLTLFLSSKTDLSLVDLLKLWKGLFFCMCHLKDLSEKIYI